MFTKEVVGTANALVGGWGNLGASITQIVMGSFLLPVFKALFDGDSELAWRTVSIVPAMIGFATGVAIYFISDDAPKGNYHELKKNSSMPEISASESFYSASMDFNTWVLFIQYACCFGVELTMNNAAALYFKVRSTSCTSGIVAGRTFVVPTCDVSSNQDVFGQSTDSAGAIASIFGWMNLFARGLGGVLSDTMNESMGMRGRLIAQSVLLLCEGVAVIVFAHTDTLAGAVIVLVMFSLFVQAAEGTSYGIVPYVNPRFTGSVTGIVGAGGNVGAVCFGLGFRNLDYDTAFSIMGASVIVSSVLSMFISIKGHRGLLNGEDVEVDKETGEIVDTGNDDNDQQEERRMLKRDVV
jgi:NNP family nitrate/nitrite transporter-like MFS transporter